MEMPGCSLDMVATSYPLRSTILPNMMGVIFHEAQALSPSGKKQHPTILGCWPSLSVAPHSEIQIPAMVDLVMTATQPPSLKNSRSVLYPTALISCSQIHGGLSLMQTNL